MRVPQSFETMSRTFMRQRLFPQIYLPALFILAALLAYSSNLNSYFLSDDFVQIGKVLHRDFSVAWGQEHGGFFSAALYS